MKPESSEAGSFGHLLSLVPSAPRWQLDWERIWPLWPELGALDTCPQDPIHHAEGDVGTHTRMVVEALVASPHWRSADENDRSCLFWAAVLHDVGKPATTKHEEEGRVTSRGHSRVGASITRQLLWDAGADYDWRERVCGLILCHQLPFWLIEREDYRRQAIKTSWKCQPDLLCLHARADAIGRMCSDQQAILDNVDVASQVFEENGCLRSPFAFANDESRVGFFEKSDRDPHFAAYEDFRCKVILMSGLPGAGKDTWIGNNCPDLPVVSLDAVRDSIGERASGNQGRVIQAAYEMARDHLRKKQDFVWNATNISEQLRGKPLRLFRDYGAFIEIAYLEPSRRKLFEQNRNRPDAVPDTVLANLIKKLEPPGEWEAHKVVRIVEK
ncbi:AAA family ATPase [Roseibium sp.]|uniref:AAA family ATPase n=1 Tax=Roseibium sp. TaxID=1936156 RepID=UPI003B50888C